MAENPPQRPVARPDLGPLTPAARGLADAAAAFRPVIAPARPPQPPRESARAVLAQAVRLREAGQIAQSILHFERAASLDPGNALIPLDIGTAYIALGQPERALAPLIRAAEIDPGLARAHFHLGLALERLGREGEAMTALERAVACAPKLAEAHRRLGALYHSWRNTPLAARAYRAAAAAARSRVEALRDTALAFRAEDDIDTALALLRRAQALRPADPEVAEMIAGIMAERGEFAEAERLYRFVLQQDPRRAASALGLFSIARASAADDPLLERLAAEAGRPEIGSQGRMLLGFALGRAHEQRGEFAIAMRHFDAANAIRAAIASLDRAALSTQVERLIEAFPAAQAGRGARAANGTGERAIFILGLPRSGTTLVEQILSSHPAVAGGGELGFWPQRGPQLLDSRAEDAAFASAGAEYCALLARIGPEARRITDKNPFNFNWIGPISRAVPGARFVHVRRSLIDTAVSLYTTLLVSRRTFFVGDREDLLFWIDTYRRLMRHWRALLPPERLLEVDYEALIGDREGETRRLLAFCGLEWDEACLYPERNRRAVATASVWQARQPVYRGSIGRWRNYAPWLGPLAKLTPPETGGVD